MLKCTCGFSITKPVYPVYCKCGRIHYKTITVDKLASNQPGTELARLIGTWFQPKEQGCQQCNDRVHRMNSWGVEGCITNKSTIIGWLVESSKENNIYAPRFVIGLAIDWAIYKARKKPR